MKIQDAHAHLNHNDTVHEFQSGSISILAEDGRPLFTIKQASSDSIEIYSGMVCKDGDRILDDVFSIKPKASNMITLTRIEYQ